MHMIVTAVAVLLIAGTWTIMDGRRRPEDVHPEFEAREERHSVRLVGAFFGVLLLLIVGLALQGLDVRVGGWIALGAAFALLVILYSGPWLGPRRRRTTSKP